MLKKLVIILLLIPILSFAVPSKVESYNAENKIPKEAFKASGATFYETEIVMWNKYGKKQEAQKLKEKWQKALFQNKFNYTGKIVVEPDTHYIIANLKSAKLNANFIPSTSEYQSIIYKGYFTGQIDKLTRDKIISKIIKLTDAKQIDNYGDNRSYFWIGYSHLIKNAVVVEDDKVNLNIALRYSAIDDKTYIFIGTPIITMEY